MSKVYDKLDYQICPGDFIAYAVRDGNSGAMRIGKVLKVKVAPRPPFRSWGPLEIVTITVRGIDDSWTKIELNKANGTLCYPDRIIVLQRDQVPETYLDLLDPVEVLS